MVTSFSGTERTATASCSYRWCERVDTAVVLEKTVAYCAPGKRKAAEELMAQHGIEVDELIEHPYVSADFDGVMLVTPPSANIPVRDAQEKHD